MASYRGRLLFPQIAEIYRVDLAGTAADPDGGGALTSGYDDVYREAVKVPSADRLGTSARAEMAAVKLPAQIEPGMLQKLMMIATGDSADGRVVVVLHFEDLEAQSLVDATTGAATIKKGDRLGAIRRLSDDVLIQTIPNPPGLFVTEALPIFGLGSERNLLQVTFEPRSQG